MKKESGDNKVKGDFKLIEDEDVGEVDLSKSRTYAMMAVSAAAAAAAVKFMVVIVKFMVVMVVMILLMILLSVILLSFKLLDKVE